MNRRWTYGLSVVLILILAVVLRMYKLGEWSMWIDEGMTYIRSSTGVLNDQGPLYSTAPLNFWITRWVILATEPSLFWMRLFPAACGCLAVGAVMWAGHLIGGRYCALVAGLVVALSAWHVDWSQNARHFSLLFLLATLAVTAYYEFWESGRAMWIVASGAASVLGFATHSSMAFVLVALAAYTVLLVVFVSMRSEVVTRRKLILAAIFFLVIGGGYLPIASAVTQYMAEYKSAWNTPINVAGSIVFYLGAFEASLAACVGIIGAVHGRRGHLLALCWMMIPAALPVLAAPITTSSNAYAFPALGGMSVLLGLSVADLAHEPRRQVRLLAAAICAAIGLSGLSGVYLYFGPEAGNRPPWREAVVWLLPQLKDDDLIFSTEGIPVGFHLGDARRGNWVDAWPSARKDQRQWVLVLGGRDGLADSSMAAELRDRCNLRRVIYRNTGPKRRDVEIYECAPRDHDGSK